MNNVTNFWSLANKFLDQDGLTFSNLEDETVKYFNENEFSHNEKMLFRYSVQSAIEFKFTIASLKHSHD